VSILGSICNRATVLVSGIALWGEAKPKRKCEHRTYKWIISDNGKGIRGGKKTKKTLPVQLDLVKVFLA
jgi:hypothetical protein